MNRAVDLEQGTAFVVADLHGAWEPYVRYRDYFLELHEQGLADQLIFLGDIIHGYGPPEEDHSLPMLWDIMQLQKELGGYTVIMLLGNHELPHIYSVALSKGEMTFTPRFEHTLGKYRPFVIEFLHRLPFVVRTAGGVMLTHAGAAASVATPDIAGRMLNFSHKDLLDQANRLLDREDVVELLASFLPIDLDEYDRLARHYLAVSGPDDPRYYDVLRGYIVSNLVEWIPLWDFFFTQCEAGVPIQMYRQTLERFLAAYSAPEMPQRVLVSGHMAAKEGREVIADHQLRLASWAHAVPQEAGSYLLFNVAKPVTSAADLLPHVHRMP
jgi:hypothetical protein